MVVIASGETERRALPHLVSRLIAEDITVIDVRRPDRNKALNVDMAEKLVKAVWYSSMPDSLPDKFVILVDVDGKDSEEVLRPFRDQLRDRLADTIDVSLQFAFAQWHLEAWYFADEAGIRGYLGRDLGSVDASQPDTIQNPKLHLRALLRDRVYTSVISEEIAKRLNPEIIAQRSGSFRGFLDSIRNGGTIQGAPH